MRTKMKFERKAPLRWRRQDGNDLRGIEYINRGWDYHRGGDVLGRVLWSNDHQRWYFKCKDGRNSLLAGEDLFTNPDEAKAACKEHVERYLD